MAEIVLRPRGPYSLELSARLAGDATRRMREGLFTARCEGGVARAWQSPDGAVTVRSESADCRREAPLDARGRRRPLRVPAPCRRRSTALPSLPPPVPRPAPAPTATVAQPLLRAVCGQLIDFEDGTKTRAIRDPAALYPVPRTQAPACRSRRPPLRSAPLAPSSYGGSDCTSGAARRSSALCRTLELERFHDLPTDTVVSRIERERGLGPWSAGVVCLEGLGRFEHGLVGDLGLIKLVRALRDRHAVETWETAELLEPYGEWAGLASVYLLAGFGRGVIPLPTARAA